MFGKLILYEMLKEVAAHKETDFCSRFGLAYSRPLSQVTFCRPVR